MAVPYKLIIKTSDKLYAGTDANVCIVIIGPDGKVDTLLPRRRIGDLKRGETCIVDNLNLCEVGHPIYKIRIGHDNTRAAAGWHLDSVIIEKPMPGMSWKDTQAQYVFEFNRWLSSSDDDHATVREMAPARYTEREHSTAREIIPTAEQRKKNAVTVYELTVKTGDVFGAGTDANVFCTLFGEFGDSGERALDHEIHKHVNKFEKNDTDMFTIEAVNLGTLKKLHIRHDNSYPCAAWFLDHVIVRNLTNDKSTMFQCRRWLSRSDDDNRVARDLVPE